jgi:hypothetical protein
MIIDADCHVSSHKFDSLAITADELVDHMDRAGVDKALVWLTPPTTRTSGPKTGRSTKQLSNTRTDYWVLAGLTRAWERRRRRPR